MANPHRLTAALKSLFARALLCLVLSICSSASWASVPLVDRWVNHLGHSFYTPDEACADIYKGQSGTTGWYESPSPGAHQCWGSYGANPKAFGPWGLDKRAGCPANSTRNGSGSCDCNAGTNQVGGQCVVPNTKDEKCAGDFNLSGFALGSGKLLDSQVLSGEVPSGDMCWPYDTPSSGCTVRFVQDKVVTMPGGTKQTYGRIGMYQGAPGATQGKACDVPAATPGDGTTVEEKCSKAGYASSESSPGGRVCLDPPKCPGGFGGEVNGVEVCVKDEGTNVVKSEKNTETKNKDGSTDKVSEKTTCQGKTCTTEKTTTNTPSGGGSSTVINSSTVVQSKEDYCKSNANSAQCNSSANGEKDGKGGSFGGSCEGGFTCEGDALQCAIARDQHKRNCQMFDDKTTESQLYDSEVAKGSNRDVTKDLPGNTEVDVAGKLSSEDVLGGGRCIADLSVQVWKSSVTLPFSNICPSLGYLGWVLVAVCSLAAFRIVSGPSKED